MSAVIKLQESLTLQDFVITSANPEILHEWRVHGFLIQVDAIQRLILHHLETEHRLNPVLPWVVEKSALKYHKKPLPLGFVSVFLVEDFSLRTNLTPPIIYLNNFDENCPKKSQYTTTGPKNT